MVLSKKLIEIAAIKFNNFKCKIQNFHLDFYDSVSGLFYECRSSDSLSDFYFISISGSLLASVRAV